MSDDVDEPYDLVMPFATVQPDGPHDPTSYVCGYEMGILDASLRAAALPNLGYFKITTGMHRENVPQADLIAMKHGFVFEYEALGDDDSGWVEATFDSLTDGAVTP